jgi:multidrug transporter EmrE-like cation transporter
MIFVARQPHARTQAFSPDVEKHTTETCKKSLSEKEKEKGLFQLFLSKTLCEAILGWTNFELERKGRAEILLRKLMAYVGLEMAMSLIQIGSIYQYWEGHVSAVTMTFAQQCLVMIFRQFVHLFNFTLHPIIQN